MTILTFQYPAQTTRGGYHRLEQAMLDVGLLYNALVKHQQSSTGAHRRRFSLKLQNAHLTDLHRNDPTYNKYGRKILEGTTRRLNRAYSTAFKHPEVGFSRTQPPHRNNTIEISEPSVTHLRIDPPKEPGDHTNKGTSHPHIQARPPIAPGPTAQGDTDNPHSQEDKPQPGIQHRTQTLRTGATRFRRHRSRGQIPDYHRGQRGVRLPGPRTRRPAAQKNHQEVEAKIPEAERRGPEGRQGQVHQSEKSRRKNQAAVPVGDNTIQDLPESPGTAPTSRAEAQGFTEGPPAPPHNRAGQEISEHLHGEHPDPQHDPLHQGNPENPGRTQGEPREKRPAEVQAQPVNPLPGLAWHKDQAEVQIQNPRESIHSHTRNEHQQDPHPVQPHRTQKPSIPVGIPLPGMWIRAERRRQRSREHPAPGSNQLWSGQKASLNVSPEAPRGNKRKGKRVPEHPGPSVRAAHTKAGS